MKISIAMCTYNAEKFLREQMESLFSQTMIPDEIIICDDLSSDETVNIINDFDSKYPNIIKLTINDLNLGVYKNFEKAISLCTGDIIFCCDHDDVWKNEKIEKFVEKFNENPDATLVFSNAAVVFEKPENYLYPLWKSESITDSEHGTSSFKTLVYQGGSIAGCCMAFRKDFIQVFFPFPNEIYHDDWLATCNVILGKIVFIDEELIYYRQHGNNVVGIIRGNKLSYWKSLITNVKPYIEHLEYIYQRHVKIVNALIEADLVNIEQKQLLSENLKFSEHRSLLRKQKFSNSISNALSDFPKGFYTKYAKGNYEVILDIYDAMIARLFMR